IKPRPRDSCQEESPSAEHQLRSNGPGDQRPAACIENVENQCSPKIAAAGRRCRAAADEGGQRLGQYHPSPGLRIGSCEVGPDSQIGRQPFISLFFLLPARRVTGGKTTSTIRISPFLPQSRPNACPQRNETGSPETTSKTLSIATSHQPTVGVSLETFARRNGVVWRPSPNGGIVARNWLKVYFLLPHARS